VFFDTGITDGGPISPEELGQGLDAWLEHQGWRRLEEVEATVEI
jgi:dihydroorotate dehydrogenase